MKTKMFRLSDEEELILPVVPGKHKAGGYGKFESPSSDFPDESLSIMKLLVKDKDTTFFARVSGDSLNGVGIFHEDILVVQRGMIPRYNDVVSVCYGGDFWTKVFRPKYDENGKLREIQLKSKNPDYEDIYISEDDDFQLWGVVTWNLHKLR